MTQNRNPTPRKPVALPERLPKQNRHPSNDGNAFVTIEEAAAQLARRRPY